jgi:hypothetical protein
MIDALVDEMSVCTISCMFTSWSLRGAEESVEAVLFDWVGFFSTPSHPDSQVIIWLLPRPKHELGLFCVM